MPAYTIESLDLALRAGLVALTLFVAALLLREHPRHLVARLGAALSLGVAAYAVQSHAGFGFPPHGWQAPVMALSAGNAVVFWLFSRALFDDDFELRPWHGAVWLVLAAAPVVNCFVLRPEGHAAAKTLGDAISVATLAFSMLAVGQSVATWRDDLVERRRRLRVFIVAGGAAYTAVATFVRLGSAGVPSTFGVAGVLDMAVLIAIVLVVAWQLVRVSDGGMFERAAVPSPGACPPAVVEPSANECASLGAEEPTPKLAAGETPTDAAPAAPALADEDAAEPALHPADAALVARLEHLMTVERFHQDDDASIGTLADRLGLPEHRLRKLINQRLGYRNFNAFLNHYRLADAKTALADPSRADVPVLTIAMEAGFQSLGPFNRAFKADTGLTPTEFRRLGRARPPAEVGIPMADFEIG